MGYSSSEYPTLFRVSEKNKMASRFASLTEDKIEEINGSGVSKNSSKSIC